MEQLDLAVRTLRQLREVLAAISMHAGDMTPAAISSIAGLAVRGADQALAEIGLSS